MKNSFLIIILIHVMAAVSAKENTIEEKIINMEKAALERWYQGDPMGFIELSANDVSYFDPYLENQLDGLNALTKLYGSFRGKVQADRFEMTNIKVQATKEMAFLSYNLLAYTNNVVDKWNGSEVYRLKPDGKWKIVHTHFSMTQPIMKE